MSLHHPCGCVMNCHGWEVIMRILRRWADHVIGRYWSGICSWRGWGGSYHRYRRGSRCCHILYPRHHFRTTREATVFKSLTQNVIWCRHIFNLTKYTDNNFSHVIYHYCSTNQHAYTTNVTHRADLICDVFLHCWCWQYCPVDQKAWFPLEWEVPENVKQYSFIQIHIDNYE